MFGEYALYLDGKVVAFACDNSLFIKPAEATAALTTDLPRGQPYPNARPHVQADALLDDPPRLRQVLLATEQALPPPPRRSAAR